MIDPSLVVLSFQFSVEFNRRVAAETPTQLPTKFQRSVIPGHRKVKPLTTDN
jgi:hypothetical protein